MINYYELSDDLANIDGSTYSSMRDAISMYRSIFAKHGCKIGQEGNETWGKGVWCALYAVHTSSVAYTAWLTIRYVEAKGEYMVFNDITVQAECFPS